MKPVASKDGIKIAGLFRSSNGGLAVDDQTMLNKALMEKKRIDDMQNQISSLNNTVNELAEMVKQLVNKNGN